MAAKKKIDELNEIYEKDITNYKDLFAEQRSNAMLVAGNHYSNKVADSFNRLKDLKNIAGEQKLRLTKNHISKITKVYHNNIISKSPAVKIIPRVERDNQSRKTAELSNSVWQYAVDTLDIQLKTLRWAKDYVDLGETAVKVFWNPNWGKVIAHNQKIDEQGEPVVDEFGQPVGDESNPIREGRLEIEQIIPTNLGLDVNASCFEDSSYVWVRKMMSHKDLKALVGNDEEKLKLIEENKKDSQMVFDTSVMDYMNTKEQSLVVEYYFRPCAEYPKGYYYITTKLGILFEGELPFGTFPIEYEGFDPIVSNPRHRSIIKQLRPYQLEINRTASKIAEHQITSDDKVLVQNGTKVSSGAIMAGIRVLTYSGQAPTVLEGRSGAQYLDYMSSQIQEMYQIAAISEDMEEKPTQSADPYGLLFRSVKDQKKLTIYVEKFEHYLKRICKLYLTLAKQYLDENHLIPMIGKVEYVNISEFKNAKDIDTDVKVMPMTDDVNSMFGKWLAINHMIQYSSAALGKEDIGRLARNIPFGNFEESFSDIMLDYDLGTNLLLALDRGEPAMPSKADNKTYLIKRIEKRMRESDFNLLNPQIQQNYSNALNALYEMDAAEKMEIQRAQSGFIPTTGPLVRTDLKTEIPNASGGMKTVSKSFPIDALAWLEKQMSAQGAAVEDLMTLNQSAQAGVASQINSMTPSQGNTPNMAAQPQGVPNGNGNGITNQFPRS